MNNLLRNLPRVDDVLGYITLPAGDATPSVPHLPRAVLVHSIREILSTYRTAIQKGEYKNIPPLTIPQIAAHAITHATQTLTPTLRPVINATGIVLHTNLGRAPMPAAVAEHIKQVAMGYSTLEFDLTTGKRGSRTGGIESLLTELTGAEDACIVNNNAAAVLLTLSALCHDREVVVSRGELVEIGGSFRIPEVISQGGAILKEVGATNKTHPRDYRRAITENTAALLKVHTSNYKIMGFTQEVSTPELTAIAKETGVLSIYDLGSGSFVSFAGEPTVQQAVADGTDVICFSGDKLLGGPQCGIILGRKELVAKARKHPLYRALRADKLTLAALEASLLMYLDMDNAKAKIPVLSMLLASPEALKEKAAELLGMLDAKLGAKLQKTSGQAGGGSLPVQDFESWAVAIPQGENYTVEALEKHLRGWEIPIIARVHKDMLLLDVRTLDERNFENIATCLHAKK